MNERKLSEALAEVFKEEIEKDISLEIGSKGYLPQEAFMSCSARADALMYNAITRCRKIYALAIVKHRGEVHEDAHGEEETELIATMSNEDITTAETRGWWKD